MNEFCDLDECEEDITTIDFAVATVVLNEPLRITRAHRGGGEATSVEPARKRRAELLASLAKRRRVESSSESKPRGVGPSTLVVNIRQQLDILDMNLEKNNGLADFHQQQASRYFEEVLYWERRLNAVEKEIEKLLEKRMKVGKIKKYRADFARPESRISSLGITLPSGATPLANYVPYRKSGHLVFVSGQLAKEVKEDGSAFFHQGKLGESCTVEEGQAAAKACGLNMIAQVKEACGGDLSKVKSVVKVEAFVNSTPDFVDQPKVINGCSDLLVAVFGEDVGRHSRFAIGCSSLPMGVAVEIGGVFEVSD